MSDEELASLFHSTYEDLAPTYGYETRKESAVPWSEVPEQNRLLMCEVVSRVRSEFTHARVAELEREKADMLWAIERNLIVHSLAQPENCRSVMRPSGTILYISNPGDSVVVTLRAAREAK